MNSKSQTALRDHRGLPAQVGNLRLKVVTVKLRYPHTPLCAVASGTSFVYRPCTQKLTQDGTRSQWRLSLPALMTEGSVKHLRCFYPQEDIQHHASELRLASHNFERVHDSSPARGITSPGQTALHHEGPTLHELALGPTRGKCECGILPTWLSCMGSLHWCYGPLHPLTFGRSTWWHSSSLILNTNIVNHPDSWPHDAKKLAGPPCGVCWADRHVAGHTQAPSEVSSHAPKPQLPKALTASLTLAKHSHLQPQGRCTQREKKNQCPPD